MPEFSKIAHDAPSPKQPHLIRLLFVLGFALALLAFGGLALAAVRPGAAAPGSEAASSYLISKTVGLSPIPYGDRVSFTIRITNTGDVWITALPLRDVYSPAYLSYGYCGAQHTADPQPDDTADDGQLDWTDLTAAAPHGFGTDLAPGASFTVVVTFVGAADTTALSGMAAENRAAVHHALADPDGPAGPLPEEPLPDQASSAQVQVFTPT